jgi:PAS domain S-box-containing protein
MCAGVVLGTIARMPNAPGWPTLFESAFRQSRNAMVLVDEQRRIVDVNAAMVQLGGRLPPRMLGRRLFEIVVGGPIAGEAQWRSWLAAGRFTGEAMLRHADGSPVAVQWAATTEVVAGRRLILVVALYTSRWGARFRREPDTRGGAKVLSRREYEVVRYVALGHTGPEIAEELGIAHDTVRSHVRNAMDKLGARSRAHLVAKVMAAELAPHADELAAGFTQTG